MHVLCALIDSVLHKYSIHAVISTLLLRVVAVLSKSQLYSVFPAKANSLNDDYLSDESIGTALTAVEELGVAMVLRWVGHFWCRYVQL